MMPSKGSRIGPWLQGCLLVSLVAGCSGKPSGTELPRDSAHIKNFANLVADYSSNHRRTAPESTEELKAWLKKEGRGTDEDCISPRDNQDYVIYAGIMGRFVVYEQTGVNGKRYVINPGGAFEVLTEEGIESRKNSLPKARAGGGMRGGGAPK